MQKLLKIIILSFCLFFLCACVNTKAATSNIKDSVGHEFSLNLPLKKVTSTHNPTLNHLIVLGNGTSKYIAGFGRKDIASNLYSKILPDWDSIECVGSDSTSVNKEEIVKLHPDLIILPELNWRAKEKDYEGTGIDTFVCFPQDESVDSIKLSLTDLAKLFGEEERASLIIDKYNEIYNDVNASVRDVKTKPKVVFFGPQLYTVAAKNMIQNDLIESAGSRCIDSNVNNESYFVSVEPETLNAQNPEYIFIPSYAKYSVDDILNDKKLSNIDAVKQKNVFKFPSALEPWDYATCSSCLGLCWLVNKLHPEVYSKDRVVSNSLSFYKLLYNHDFTFEELGLQ
ncbi:MAG: ABC transporter substrate-binding protein [Coriobacteriia bacterium]|nr:ABC transporter substrate-binding protein [Coriobacteriia bacterium]